MGSFASAPLHCTQHRRFRLLRLASLPEAAETAQYSQPLRSSRAVIRCQLIETSLDKAPPFIAISHAWGLPTDQSIAIFLNGTSHNVSGTLVDLLTYLQKYCRPLNNLFWIDALCINHDDALERGIQVSLMHHIYEKAWVLIAWLGTPNAACGREEKDDGEDETEEDDNTTRHNHEDGQSFRDIHTLHGFFHAYAHSKDRYGLAMKRKEPRHPSFPYAHRTKEVLVYEVDANGQPLGINTTNPKELPGQDKTSNANESPSIVEARLRYHIQNQQSCREWTWAPISRLLARPWFSRTWLLQEICCAKNVQLAFGSQMISWKLLTEVCEAIAKYGLQKKVCHIGQDSQLSHSHSAGLSHVIAVDAIRQSLATSRDIDLAQLLLGTSSLFAQNGHDRVYSLLGLARHVDRAALPVDYASSKNEFAVNLMAHLVASSPRPTAVLSLAGMGWGPSSAPSLPSWVPSWHNLDLRTNRAYSQQFSHTKPNGAGTRQTLYGNTRQLFATMPDLNTLRAEGYIVDKVQYLITTPCPNIDDTNLTNTTSPSIAPTAQNRTPCWREWMLNAADMLNQGATNLYPTRESLHDVLWRTLITSQTADGIPAGPEYGLSFRRSIGRPFEGRFTTESSSARVEEVSNKAETPRLLHILHTHVKSPQISPGRAYIERMAYSSPQTFHELEGLWRESYAAHGRGKCLFTTKRGFVGLAAPGLAQGGEFYITYLRDRPGDDGTAGLGKAFILKREPCHELQPDWGMRNMYGATSRTSSSSGSSSSSSADETGSSSGTGGGRVQRFRLVSECYLHGGHLLAKKARNAQLLDIY